MRARGGCAIVNYVKIYIIIPISLMQNPAFHHIFPKRIKKCDENAAPKWVSKVVIKSP